MRRRLLVLALVAPAGSAFAQAARQRGNPDGARYEGQRRNGRPHGQGSMTLASGDRYEGRFRDGVFHGRGTYIWANGDRYTGDFVAGKQQGYGEYFSIQAGWYRGSWRDGCYREPPRLAAVGRPLHECE